MVEINDITDANDMLVKSDKFLANRKFTGYDIAKTFFIGYIIGRVSSDLYDSFLMIILDSYGNDAFWRCCRSCT